ncbi:Lrp/AsnC family transcriptional regulator [Amylibacter sp.]|jgi:Lrp/AsnC family transcriptional regulator|nr:Lrp/AsnC family transcriptional regulator [Amylibacter sp.]MDB4125154.1 Lrp/AsnC family transcriptional regulator [Amylibacter sp.]MDB9919611.1 Lrp/AsnC family transcriptional regulator [Amylibacter sp.]MDC1289489.1 Lrp/AsnC family transcriptional regulator [Amylibacter sp.]MDC1497774.1 Lrp/AsnC family transcriptional regulator [Amylibacter sp.]|tara:strand:- start:168 stop:638 length:471 start_codon:yes stop_codon:yes gene_type:complete
MENYTDEIDRKILDIIQSDSSYSMDEISEFVNLSRNACWRRIRRMEEAGIIKARVALVEPSSINLGLSAFVMIRTNSHDTSWAEKFDKVVKCFPEIIGAHRMAGDLDYILRVRVRDVKDYDNFYQTLISKISISDISASFVMDDIKDTTALPTDRM